MLTVAFTNQKGGVGKTSTVVGLASALDRRGLRVLCIDLDPQADLTTWLGLDPLSSQLNVNDAIYANERGAAKAAVQRAGWGVELHCVGSTLDLAERETDLAPGSEFRLKKALQGLDSFDLALIDCPPSIGRLVVLGFVASSHVIIVTEPSSASLRGVDNVTQTLGVVQAHYNQSLEMAGIIVNNVNRTTESTLRVKEIADAYGTKVWEPHIPARAVIGSAMGAGASVADYGRDGSPVDDIYVALADKVVSLAVPAAV